MEHQDLIDLERVEHVRIACDAYATSQGINPLNIHCSHTGRILGQLNDDAIRLLIDCTNIDQFEPATLLTHCLLAARPSPTWGYQTTHNYSQLLKSDPVGASVYYLMRAYEPTITKQKSRNSFKSNGRFEHCWKHAHDKANWQHCRVILFEVLQSENLLLLQRVTGVLLKADAQIGLHHIEPPANLNFPNIVDWEELIEYYLAELKAHDARLIHRKREGNTLSSMIWHGYQRDTSPPSESRKRDMMRQEKRNDVASVFRNLLGGAITVTEAKIMHDSPEAFNEALAPQRTSPEQVEIHAIAQDATFTLE